MNIEIEIANSKIKGNIEAGNRLEISEKTNTKAKTKVNDSEVEGDICILNDVKYISDEQAVEIVNILRQEISKIENNGKEYENIIAILEINKNNKKEIGKKVREHLLSFAEGILVNIVSKMLVG